MCGGAAVYGYFVIRIGRTSHRDADPAGATRRWPPGDLSTAIEAFSGAIALKSDSMIGYLMRGDAYRRRDELEAALRDLGGRREIDPGAPRPRELLGDVNYARHRYHAGRRSLSGVRRARRSIASRSLQAGAGALPGRTAHALRWRRCSKALAIDESFAEAHYLMGLCQRDAQQPADAVASFLRAIALAPTLIAAREELADLYGRLGRTESWIAQLEALRALDPKPARDVSLGLAYSRRDSPIAPSSRFATLPSAIRTTDAPMSRSGASGWKWRRPDPIESS